MKTERKVAKIGSLPQKQQKNRLVYQNNRSTSSNRSTLPFKKNGDASGYNCGRNSKKRNLNSTTTDESDEKALHRKKDESPAGFGDVFPCPQPRKR